MNEQADDHHLPAGLETSGLFFDLFLTGNIVTGHDVDEAKSWLQTALRLSAERIDPLLQGKTSCVKRGLEKDKAEQLQRTFEAHGIAVVLRSQHNAAGEVGSKVTAKARIDGTIESPPAFLLARLSAVALIGGVSVFIAIYLFLIIGLLGLSGFLIISPLFSADELNVLSYLLFSVVPAVIALFLWAVLLPPLLIKHRFTEGLRLKAHLHPKLHGLLQDISRQLKCPEPDALEFSAELGCRASYQFSGVQFWKARRVVTLSMPMVATYREAQLTSELVDQLAMIRTPLLGLAYALSHRLVSRLKQVTLTHGGQNLSAGIIDTGDGSVFIKLKQGLISKWKLVGASLFVKPAQLVDRYITVVNKPIISSADHYAFMVVGTDTFIQCFEQCSRLQNAFEQSKKQIFEQPDNPKLVDNLPALVRHHFDKQDIKLKAQLLDGVNCGDSRRSNDYPTDRDRIVWAEQFLDDGLTCQDGSAEHLFSDVLGLYKESSLDFYRAYGVSPNMDALVDVRSMAKQALKDQLRGDYVSQYYNRWFTDDTYWRIPGVDVLEGMSDEELLKQLNLCNERIRHHTADFLKLRESEDSVFRALFKFSLATEVRKTGYSFAEGELNINAEQYQHLPEFLQEAKNNWQAHQLASHKLYGLMGKRVLLAVWLHNDEAKYKRGMLILKILSSLVNQVSRLDNLRLRVAYLPEFERRLIHNKESKQQQRIERICKDVETTSAKVLDALRKLPCLVSDEHKTLADFLLSHLQLKQFTHGLTVKNCADYFSQFNKGINAANRLLNSQLVVICQQTEEKNGVKPVRVSAEYKSTDQ